MSSGPSFAIGMDLGTTYCCVAVLRDQSKKPEVIPNDVGRNTTPSYIAYDTEEDDTYAGETAKDLAFENPENTVFDIKRLIGRTFYDSHVQRYNHLWPFHLVNIHGLVGVKIGEKTLLPQVIATELIAHLKKTAEDYLRCSITSAVVTIPVYYNDLQQGVTREACAKAGLTKVHFITEPEAAAFAYGIQSSMKSSGETKTCLIFDLGGGTFDVTIFTVDSEKRVEIKAMGGDDRLGGEDFNDLLTEYCINEFRKKHGFDLTQGKGSEEEDVWKKAVRKLRRVRNECERQKCFLSSTTTVVVSLEGLVEGIAMAVPVTRKIFEDLISEHLTRCMGTLDGVLKKNGFKKKDIDDVILIGGSSRIPKVQALVSEYFEGKTLRRSIDADEAVACGAAVHACNTFHGKSTSSRLSFHQLISQVMKKPISQSTIDDSGTKDVKTDPQKSKEEPEPEYETVTEESCIPQVKALYRFSDSSLTIEMAKGEVMILLKKTNKDWWLVRNAAGVKGFVPANYVKEIEPKIMQIQVRKLKVTWKNQAEVKFPSSRGHATVAVGHTIYSFGGYSNDKNYSMDGPIDVFILNTTKSPMHWRILEPDPGNADNPSQRCSHTVVAYGHSIYLWGGETSEKYCNILYCFDTTELDWVKVSVHGEIPEARLGHSAVVIGNKMYVFGGNTGGSMSQDLYALDLKTHKWSSVDTAGIPPAPRWLHSATVLKDRFMIIFGGEESGFHSSSNALAVLDVQDNVWQHPTQIGTVPQSRQSHSTFVHNNLMYIFGGYDDQTDEYLNDLYCCSSETFDWKVVIAAGPRPTRCCSFGCVALKDKIYIFGGWDFTKYFQDTFILEIS